MIPGALKMEQERFIAEVKAKKMAAAVAASLVALKLKEVIWVCIYKQNNDS